MVLHNKQPNCFLALSIECGTEIRSKILTQREGASIKAEREREREREDLVWTLRGGKWWCSCQTTLTMGISETLRRGILGRVMEAKKQSQVKEQWKRDWDFKRKSRKWKLLIRSTVRRGTYWRYVHSPGYLKLTMRTSETLRGGILRGKKEGEVQGTNRIWWGCKNKDKE